MDVTSCLKHLAKYWDVYWFVAEEPRTKAEIKEYLMEACYKAESTARDYLNAMSECELLSIDGDTVTINIAASLELEEDLECVFSWCDYDSRAEDYKALKAEKIRCDTDGANNYAVYEHDREEWRRKETQYKKQMEDMRRQIELLEAQKLEAQVNQKTLVLSSLEIGPEQVGLYRDTQFPLEDRHPTLDPTTHLMDTYIAEVFKGKTKSEQREFEFANWLYRVRKGIFSSKVMAQIIERTGPFKKRVFQYWPYKNLFTADKLLAMKDKTSTEKYALYVLCKGNLSKEQMELLDVAQKSGIHADFVILVLENYRVSRKSKHLLWEALKLTKDSSEFKMREAFAQELVEHKWFINGVFGGKKCKFGLVPLDDFQVMQDKLKAFIKKQEEKQN